MIYVNGYRVSDFRFPDNTIRLGPEDSGFLKQYSAVKGDHDATYDMQRGIIESMTVGNITWLYEQPSELFTLQCLVGHMRDRLGMEEIHLVMPYIPNARMDRTKDLPAEVNVLKYFCREVNRLNFASVSVMDPHSDASVSQLDRVIICPVQDAVLNSVDDFRATLLMFPDEGAAKRYGPMYNMPYICGNKDRDWRTGAIRGLKIENPCDIPFDPKARILIVDDICSRGGTFMYAGKALQDAGYQHIALWVTHLENTVFAGPLLKNTSPIERIYTTNTLKHGQHDKITVYDVLPDDMIGE